MTLKQQTEGAKNGAAEIASQLREAILQGKYRHQDRLPPERELAEEFGAAAGPYEKR
jgi:DNA-binding FadR family transcriptional regulator